ncbi:MAG: hypothetical protein DRP58_08655 [Spirochaetes bacterium]|nr:MAG: hypothetical protein DRP58_08655 [Spirochaetota bacterium]
MPNYAGLLKIGTKNILDGAITESKIADSAITESKIADGAITEPKLADSSVSLSKLANNSIDSSKIIDGSINESDLADGSVSYSKLADKSARASKVKLNYVIWHASSIPIKDVTISGLFDGLYLFHAYAEAIWNDTTQLHKLTVTSGSNDGSVDAYMVDGGGDYHGVQLVNVIQVSGGSVSFSWDGHHIHHIVLLWIGLA